MQKNWERLLYGCRRRAFAVDLIDGGAERGPFGIHELRPIGSGALKSV